MKLTRADMHLKCLKNAVYIMCLTWICEIVIWSNVCYYCYVLDYVLDYETSTFSWEGIEILIVSWENEILLSVYEETGIWTLTSFSWSYGGEMYSLR